MEAASPGGVGNRRTAFATYVLPEVELLVRVARTLTAQPAGADALVQDTLLLAYQSLPGFDGRSPRIWLLTLMGQAYGTRTARRRPPALDDPVPGRNRLYPGLSGVPGRPPQTTAADRLFHAAVEAALAGLPAKHQQVVRLVDTDGLSYAEAASVLGVPERTMARRLHRARRRMCGRLAATGLAPSRYRRRRTAVPPG